MTQHILLYTDDPGLGGVAQYNHRLLLELAAQGYRVTTVHTKSDSPLVAQQRAQGIQHRWLDFHTLDHFDRTLTNREEATHIFAQTQPDLICFSDCCPVSNLAAKQAAIDLGIPYVVVIGFVAPYLAERFTEYLDELAHQYARAQAVIAVSSENLKLLHRLFRLPLHQGQVIYYGRPPQYFAPSNQAERRRLRQEVGIPESAVVCFTAARLESVKGFQYQLKAIAQLKETPVWSTLYFVWAGEGSLRSELNQALERLEVGDRVKLLGQRWDIDAWLDAADIFVFPSELEGMPLAVMEAMAKGIPVVASAVSGIPEELGDTGKLLPDPKLDPGATIAELAATIQTWAADAALRHSIGQQEKRRAESLFKEERMIQETIALIKRAMLPAGDYVSPGLSIVQPDFAFPHLMVGDTSACEWPYLRRNIPHNWYVDRRQPTVGFLSRDEAHILYNTALQFKGKRALEVGCWLGWSACHLALAGVDLDVVDPLLERPEFYQSVSNSLRAAGVLAAVNLVPGYSPQMVEDLAARFQRKWSLMFIDGDHEAPAPLRDAMACEPFAEPDAMIVFHDLASPDVAQGLDYLRDRGWQTQVYQTMQIMGVAWRGDVQPVAHQPDPAVAWILPPHLQGYQLSQAGRDARSAAGSSPGLHPLCRYLEELTIPPAAEVNLDLEARRQLAALRPQGIALYIKADLAAAIATFTRMLELHPQSVLAHHYLSALYWQQGQIRQSLEQHALAHAASPLHSSLQNEEFQALLRVVRPYTLLSEERLFSLYFWARQICLDDIPGNFVECGTYKGGSAALLAAVIQRYSLRPRQLYAFDTFAGMPDPIEIDRHQGIPANQTGFGAGTLRAPIAQNLNVVCRQLGVQDMVVPVPGLFAETLPQAKVAIGEIAFLHADGDWYESTMDIFNTLFDSVVEAGFIQVDDYGFWEGCRQAIHDFERQKNQFFILRRIDETGVWFRKSESVSLECNHLQSLWYAAQAAEKLGEPQQAAPLVQSILKLVPNWIRATEKQMELQTVAQQTIRVPAPEVNLAQQLLFSLIDAIERYQRHPDEIHLQSLRQARQQLAEQWLKLPTDQLQIWYTGGLGQAPGRVRKSGLYYQPLTSTEQAWIDTLTAQVAEAKRPSLAAILAAMLYRQAHQFPFPIDLTSLPSWFVSDYLQFVLTAPSLFQEVGEADRYYHHLQSWVNYLHTHCLANPESDFWQTVASRFSQIANFIQVYFNCHNLKDLFVKRAELLSFGLSCQGHALDYDVPERSPDRPKLRLGILASHFTPQTETFSTLPAYEHLDRDEFEIILFALVSNNHRLERYCAGHADALVVLPRDLAKQVQVIREADLDVLLIGTNLTAVNHPLVPLALHRLARVQATLYSSPVTTGMPHIDYYISGRLTEPESGAEAHYSEQLVTLEGLGYCFHYALEPKPTKTGLTRAALGIAPEAVVLTSGANFFKIIPELRETWATILAALPDAVLVLYPFGASWSDSYERSAFTQQLWAIFDRYGIARERLILLDSIPIRADVKEYLKLADVYLDSFPYTGSHATTDPLEVGLPTVTLNGETLRSRQGPALLRALQIPELITETAADYIQLAIALGRDPALRQQMRERIRQRVQQSTFFDSRQYSAQVGALLKTLVQHYHTRELQQQFRLRALNWIAFPDWSLPEAELLETLLDLLRFAVTHPAGPELALLIHIGSFDEAEADLAVSSVLMHLLTEEGIDVSEAGPEVVLVTSPSQAGWQRLLPHLSARIELATEDQQAIACSGSANLPRYRLAE